MKKFYEDNAHLKVPDDHKTEDGYSLRSWVKEQRRRWRSFSKIGGWSLSKERMDRLNGWGFVWNENYTK